MNILFITLKPIFNLFCLVGIPIIIIYLKEKRNKINSERKDLKYFVKKFIRINLTFKDRINRYEFIFYGTWLFWGTYFFFGFNWSSFFIPPREWIPSVMSFFDPPYTNFLLIILIIVLLIFMIAICVALLLHNLAVYIKRLHDLNKSGWNILWHLIPIVGNLYLIIICFFLKGTKGSNDYGSDPNDDYKEKENQT